MPARQSASKLVVPHSAAFDSAAEFWRVISQCSGGARTIIRKHHFNFVPIFAIAAGSFSRRGEGVFSFVFFGEIRLPAIDRTFDTRVSAQTTVLQIPAQQEEMRCPTDTVLQACCGVSTDRAFAFFSKGFCVDGVSACQSSCASETVSFLWRQRPATLAGIASAIAEDKQHVPRVNR